MPISKAILSKYVNKVFCETGFRDGETIDKAIDLSFPLILANELSDHWYALGLEKYKESNFVQLFFGDSGKILGNMIRDVNDPITFWMDAHVTDYPCGVGDKDCPLKEELNHIMGHGIKTHTILIDDVRNLGTAFMSGITLDQVKRQILQINSHYKFSFEYGAQKNDILVAYV